VYVSAHKGERGGSRGIPFGAGTPECSLLVTLGPPPLCSGSSKLSWTRLTLHAPPMGVVVRPPQRTSPRPLPQRCEQIRVHQAFSLKEMSGIA